MKKLRFWCFGTNFLQLKIAVWYFRTFRNNLFSQHKAIMCLIFEFFLKQMQNFSNFCRHFFEILFKLFFPSNISLKFSQYNLTICWQLLNFSNFRDWKHQISPNSFPNSPLRVFFKPFTTLFWDLKIRLTTQKETLASGKNVGK